MAVDNYHPHDSTIVGIAKGTFKGTPDSRQRNLDHINECLLERHDPGKDEPIASCKSKYDAALKAAAPKSEAKASGDGWLDRFLHGMFGRGKA